MRLQVALRRSPLTNQLEIRLDLQEWQGSSVVTLQDGHFRLGEDMLFDRMQEHTNNFLRRFVSEWTRRNW